MSDLQDVKDFFRETLAYIIKKEEKSTRTFCVAVGLTPSYFESDEGLRFPGRKGILILSRLLNVEVDWLLGTYTNGQSLPLHTLLMQYPDLHAELGIHKRAFDSHKLYQRFPCWEQLLKYQDRLGYSLDGMLAGYYKAEGNRACTYDVSHYFIKEVGE